MSELALDRYCRLAQRGYELPESGRTPTIGWDADRQRGNYAAAAVADWYRCRVQPLETFPRLSRGPDYADVRVVVLVRGYFRRESSA